MNDDKLADHSNNDGNENDDEEGDIVVSERDQHDNSLIPDQDDHRNNGTNNDERSANGANTSIDEVQDEIGLHQINESDQHGNSLIPDQDDHINNGTNTNDGHASGASAANVEVVAERDGENENRGRKRKRNEDAWQRNRNKKLRNIGDNYRSKSKDGTVKVRIRCRMGAGCGPGCRYDCHNKIPGNSRQQIFDEFWLLGDVTRQRNFIMQVTEEKKQATNRRRKTKYDYFLPCGEKHRVCKEFFRHTLGISHKAIATCFSKKVGVGMVDVEKRGRHASRPPKVPDVIRQQIKQHILLFPTIDAHYVRKDSRKKYLDANLSLAEMYRLYLEWCADNGATVTAGKKWLYNEIFTSEFNYSFFYPKERSMQPVRLDRNPKKAAV